MSILGEVRWMPFRDALLSQSLTSEVRVEEGERGAAHHRELSVSLPRGKKAPTLALLYDKMKAETKKGRAGSFSAFNNEYKTFKATVVLWQRLQVTDEVFLEIIARQERGSPH